MTSASLDFRCWADNFLPGGNPFQISTSKAIEHSCKLDTQLTVLDLRSPSLAPLGLSRFVDEHSVSCHPMATILARIIMLRMRHHHDQIDAANDEDFG